MLALNVAHLIPDIGNDGVALGFDFRPFGALELLHRWQTVPGGARSELAPAFISRAIEVENFAPRDYLLSAGRGEDRARR